MYMYLHIQMEVNQRCQVHRPERDLPKSNAHMQSQNTEDGNEGRGSIAKYLTKKPQLRTESKPCEGCQSGIWSGCNEIWVDWIQLYPYVKLIG
jgi:hypothetical protein